jgi:hypothetical protein
MLLKGRKPLIGDEILFYVHTDWLSGGCLLSADMSWDVGNLGAKRGLQKENSHKQSLKRIQTYLFYLMIIVYILLGITELTKL